MSKETFTHKEERKNLRKKVRILHGNIIKSEPGRYIAFFDEFPEVVAQGSTKPETKERLLRALISILQRKKKEGESLVDMAQKSNKVSRFELTADI